MPIRMSRRAFLQVSGLAGIGLLAACAAPAAGPAPVVEAEATAVPTPAAIAVGSGDVELTMWVQDFGPVVQAFEDAATQYAEAQGNVSVTVQPVPYADLQAKMLPAVAAGTEADIVMGYTSWYLATDISRVWLQLDDFFGGRAALEEIVFPSAMNLIDTPNGAAYYLPYLSGLDGIVTTVNVNHYKEAGIDYLALATFEELVEAGKTLTQFEGDTLTRAGLSMIDTAYFSLMTLIYQKGGNFFDLETGVWSFNTEEGAAALQLLHDLIWVDKTAAFGVYDSDGEGFLQNKVSSHCNGAYTIASSESQVPELDADGIPLPPLADAVENVVSPYNIAVVTLSRRLADSGDKLDASVGVVGNLFSADALLAITEVYSGALASQSLYSDPRIEQTKYGPLSKRIAEATWGRARYPQGRVASPAPAMQEVDRALRQEITIQEALANLDAYHNEQESQVRERLAS